jgi:hypothetical protein
MKRLLQRGAALALLVLAVRPAGADPISWGFDWNNGPVKVYVRPPKNPLDKVGYVSLSSESFKTAFDNSDLAATNLQTFSTAPATKPDTFAPFVSLKNPGTGYYFLTIDLSDLTGLPGHTGSLTFFGKLDGSISAGNSNLTNQFIGPTTQSLLLGNDYFIVSLTSFSPPEPPSPDVPGGKVGSIGAHVDVLDAHRALPEPTTLLLAGLGAGLAGLAGWRRPRAPVPSA